MRKLLLPILVVLCIAVSAGAAWARFVPSPSDPATGPQASVSPLDPLRAPTAQPRALADLPGSYAFVSSSALAAEVGGDTTAGTNAAPAGGASVRVTATVLPAIVLVVEDGELVQVIANTPQRDGRRVAYVVMEDVDGGERLQLDAELWRAAHRAFRTSTAGTGTIWERG